MPSLGADMEQGKVVEWLVEPGDYVHRGDLIAEVDTEKTVMEVESFEEGIVAEFLVELGETVPVGTPIARITGTPADGAHVGPLPAAAPQASTSATAPARRHRTHGPDPKRERPPEREPAPPGRATPPIRHLAHELGVNIEQLHGTGRHGAITRSDVEAAAEASAVPMTPAAATAAPMPTAGRVRSSPLARRLASELGLDLAGVRGTGPGGAVTETDLHRAAEAAAPASPPRSVPAPAAPAASATAERRTTTAAEAPERVASIRRAVGALMARSKREIPHYYLSTTIDLGAVMDWMLRVNAERPMAARLVPAALLLAASARAAKDVPEVNGFFLDGAFQPSSAVHLGVAVALRGGGLVAPAIHDADSLTVDELMERLRDLVARARAGRLQRAEMADPTITVTNLGDLGVETVFGVIYPPQVALLGFGRVVEQPRAVNGLIGVRPAVTATLSADHRVSDGLRGGRLLARIDELLQKPEEL